MFVPAPAVSESYSPLLTQNVVKDHSQHTIGVEFSSRTVKLGEKRIKLQVRYFDIPRQAESYSLTFVCLPSSYGIQQDKNDFGEYSATVLHG